MRQAIRQHPFVIYAISFGLMTVCMSPLLPIPSASAQQLTGTVSQGTIGTNPQERLIENSLPTRPTKSLEKKDTQTLTYTPHRLIRKSKSAPVASVEPSPFGSSPVSSVPTHSVSLETDKTTSQSTEPLSFDRTVGTTVPLATMSVAPSSTTTGSLTVGTTTTGTILLAAAGTSSTSTSGGGSAGGRSMSRLAAEMSGLTQLLSSPSAPGVSVNPAIGTSPTSLSFSAQQGGSNPVAQTVTISNTGGGTLNWSANASTTWLSVSPASGTSIGAVTVTVGTAALTAGTYNGVITITATGASSMTVPVTFTVTTAPVPPAIGASPTSLAFTATQGGSNPANQTLSISNTGGGTLNWSASPNTTWLAVSPASATGNGTLTVSASTGILTAGSYTGNIILSATGASNITVPVTFTVTSAQTISLSPSNLNYTATQLSLIHI